MDKKFIQILRKCTGAGLNACMEAARTSNGNLDQAVQILKERGRLMMDEKSMRFANEGMICILCDDDRQYAVMLELNCETDFVANNDLFVDLAYSLAKHLSCHVLKKKDITKDDDPDSKMRNQMEVSINKINDTTLTTRAIEGNLNNFNTDIKELISDATLKLREKIQLSKCVIYQLQGPGFVTFYLHNKSKQNQHVGRLGVLLAVSGYNWQQADIDLRNRAYKVSMHIAAMQPLAIDREQLANELIDRKTIEIKKSSDLQNKPKNIADKILSGKMHKFYQEIVLMEQSFVMSDDKSVGIFWQEKHTSDNQYGIMRFDFFKVET